MPTVDARVPDLCSVPSLVLEQEEPSVSVIKKKVLLPGREKLCYY